MPNHVINIITVVKGEYNLDNIKSFSDVLPIPKELEDEVSDGLVVLIERAVGSSLSPYLKSNQGPTIDDIKKRYENDARALERIDKALINIEKYGHASWYSWSIENWGTKWDMYDRELISNGSSLLFNTAWSPPIQWAEELAETLPDGVTLLMQWADEDFGCNTGEAFLSNKSCDINYDEDQSDQAYERAIELLGKPDNLECVNGFWKWHD